MPLKPFALPLVLLLASCDIPRDPEGTLDRVIASRIIRLGDVAGAEPDPEAEQALAALSRRTGAHVERVTGHGEELLEALDEGEIDLVYGRFADDSPWMTKVHFGTPPSGPRKPAKSQRVARFAFRMGENGWITAVEDAASSVRKP